MRRLATLCVTRLGLSRAQNVRDDLIVDLTSLPGGGLPVLPAAVGIGDYDAYLAVVPGCVWPSSAPITGRLNPALARMEA